MEGVVFKPSQSSSFFFVAIEFFFVWPWSVGCSRENRSQYIAGLTNREQPASLKKILSDHFPRQIFRDTISSTNRRNISPENLSPRRLSWSEDQTKAKAPLVRVLRNNHGWDVQ